MRNIALKYDINPPPLTITFFLQFISVLLHAISCCFVSYEGFFGGKCTFCATILIKCSNLVRIVQA